ncbi:Hypothetical predicted protein, partial [Paramuricea clavata]
QACEHPPSRELESQLPVSQQQPPQIKVSGKKGLGLCDVKMPAKMKARGRPKGIGQTAIGVPKKSKDANLPTPYAKKCREDKTRLILHWFIDNHTAESAISKEQMITEKELKANKDISFACLDENIEIARIKPYFTAAGWSAVLKSVKELKKTNHVLLYLQERIRRRSVEL